MGELAVGVHAMNYVCGVQPWQSTQHLCGCGVRVCVTGRGDLRIWGLQRPSWPPTFPFYGWRGNRHDAGCGASLAGATEAEGCLIGEEEGRKTDVNSENLKQKRTQDKCHSKTGRSRLCSRYT